MPDSSSDIESPRPFCCVRKASHFGRNGPKLELHEDNGDDDDDNDDDNDGAGSNDDLFDSNRAKAKASQSKRVGGEYATSTLPALGGQPKRSVSFDIGSTKGNKTSQGLGDNNDDDDYDQELSATTTFRQNSSTSSRLRTLRRSPRNTIPKSGPQSYKRTWHPVDDLKCSKPSGRNNSRVKVKTSSSKGLKGSPVMGIKTSISREENAASEDKITSHGQSRGGQASTHPGRRRSSRITYNEETAMKYDMNLQFEKLQQPHVFARRLEKKRQSIALHSPKLSNLGADATSVAPPRVQKSLEPRQEKPTSAPRAEINVETHAGDNETSLALPVNTCPKSRLECPLRVADMLPNATLSETKALDAADEHHMLPDDVLPAALSKATSSRFVQEGLRDVSLTQALPNGANPYLKLRILDWNELSSFDRRLFLLQQGAPIKGSTLPFDWSVVKQTLLEEGFEIALDAASKIEDTEYLQGRYESIRLGVEAFFKASPEAEDKIDWTLFQVEGYDVYEFKRGRKYWKNIEESIVGPLATNLEPQLRGRQSHDATLEPNNQSELTEEQMKVIDYHPVDVNDERAVDHLIPDTQLDEFLAIAEPYGEANESFGSIQQRQSIASNRTSHDDEKDAYSTNDRVSHERSEKTLVDLMKISQPVTCQETDSIAIAEIEALLDEVRSSQEEKAQTSNRPPLDMTLKPIVTSSAKRRRRKTAADFFIFEDTDANDAQPPNETSQRLDLPVENMPSQDLNRWSQAVANTRPSRRAIRQHISPRNHLSTPARRFRPSPGGYRSIFGGPSGSNTTS